MPPIFKNPFRNLLSSVIPMSSLGSEAGSKAVPVGNAPMFIVVWFQLIMALLGSWNMESKAVWAELVGFRVDKAYVCKNESGNEHEYVVFDMSRPEHREHLFLRLERSAGERKGSPTSSPSSSSISSYDSSDSEKSSDISPLPSRIPDFYERSSGSSISIQSMKEGISKVTDTFHRAVRRLSDSSLSRPSGISSNQYLAADSVTKLNSFSTSGIKVIRTIEFHSPDRFKRPCLWDIMILAYVMHQDSMTYELFERQCFWFADTISAVLEHWFNASGDVSITDGKPMKSRFLRRNRSSGSVGILVVHQRKDDVIEKIRQKFRQKRDELEKQRQGFVQEENARMQMARELAEVKKQQELERKEREKERLERDERERQLQQEREKERLERDERERQLQQEREKERLELQEQLHDNNRQFQEQLQDNNRQWELRMQHLQQKDHEKDLRLQEIEQMIRMFRNSQTQLTAPGRPAYPNSHP
ncbi:hypothetical protein M378DRAFT_197158 [Amanita muscaria Koide BX008]|uniref:Uncharacterized protein n=1 Tax=Amanita muscaria (strain Koide BX008) TaxID=946122 RepID=A0A0C2XD40_AMAMK|nr:hypothetical protein M378DRAFT_197158 [Amanita muscaria Koide BX008]